MSMSTYVQKLWLNNNIKGFANQYDRTSNTVLYHTATKHQHLAIPQRLSKRKSPHMLVYTKNSAFAEIVIPQNCDFLDFYCFSNNNINKYVNISTMGY